MSATNDDAPSRNAQTATSLRQVADWLDAHPELPECRYASLLFRGTYEIGVATPARETLTRVAEALGDRATEKRYGGDVTILGKFGDVSVTASARVSDLQPDPVPEPAYEPILQARSVQWAGQTDVERAEFGPRTKS